MYRRFGKRALDIVLSVLSLAAFSPLLILIAVWVKLDSHGPVLFRQKRVGRDRELFEIFKFRTMRQDAPHDVPTHELRDSARYITRSGRVLRKTSLDELPQLFNILLGQMSFIGPRPALWNQDDLLALRDAFGANAARPGLSGLAQVSGRDDLSLKEKARLDGEYAGDVRFSTDIRCFVLTVVKVFRREGIAEGREGRRYAGKRTEDKP